MKCYSKNAFSLVETIAALAILAIVTSSVFVVINRSMDSAADSALRMQAFETARENMELLLISKSVTEKSEYGTSEKYPAIEWQTIVEAFYEPITSRMWIQALCSAAYTDSQGQEQTVELTHWLTNISALDAMEMLKRKETEKELADQIIETVEDAALYAEVDEETIEQWIDNGMETTDNGRFTKGMIDLYKKTDGNPTEEEKNYQLKADTELVAALYAAQTQSTRKDPDDSKKPDDTDESETEEEQEEPEKPERIYCGYTESELMILHGDDPAAFWKLMWSCEDF